MRDTVMILHRIGSLQYLKSFRVIKRFCCRGKAYVHKKSGPIKMNERVNEESQWAKVSERVHKESRQEKASERLVKESPQQFKTSTLRGAGSLQQGQADERFDKESL